MPFSICAIVQHGRLQYEAVLFMASFVRSHPNFDGQVIFLEPVQNDLWQRRTKIDDKIRAYLTRLGAQIIPFTCTQFGERYPHGNKIEALKVIPTDMPFVFFDTDTLFCDDIRKITFDFDRPSASLRRTNTWPKTDQGFTGAQVWGALYDMFGLDFESTQDTARALDDWQRYLYFNAGWFFAKDAQAFHDLFLTFATQIETRTPKELAGQKLNPWLDQITLPLVIHALGGGRASDAHGMLDGSVTYHYRTAPLLFAKGTDAQVSWAHQVASDPVVQDLLAPFDPFAQVFYTEKADKIRTLAAQYVGQDEGALRRALRAADLWYR